MEQNKVVGITGAAGGIGFGLAKKFYEAGWDLSLCDLDLETLKVRCEDAGLEAARVYLEGFDATNRKNSEKWIKKTYERFGRIDCLVCNAGIAHRSLFLDTDPSVLEKVMAVNFHAALYLSHAAMPFLLASGGSLVGISSVAGFSPLYGRTGYVSSKFALSGLFETIRSELEPQIQVCLVYPSFVKTEFDKNTMDGSGKKLNRSKPLIGKPLEIHKVAEKIYQAVIQKKKRLVLSPVGKISWYLSRIFPDFFIRQMRKRTQSEFQN